MSLSVDKYEEVADKDDLMGVEDTAKKGFFSKPSLKSRNTIFTLGQRGAVLSPAELEGPILIPHTAQRGDCRVRPLAVLYNLNQTTQAIPYTTAQV